MKKLLSWVIGVPFLCLLLITASGKKAIAQDVAVSFQAFYDNLAPYGQWIYDPQYGNVFVPYEDQDFRPYTRGHWVMTEYGNTWVSDDPWGWACYHYGRWTYNGYYGWIWIPGYEWAPSWVSWRYGHGYCGWAPLGPGYYRGDDYYCPDTWWVFVEPRYMYEPRWHDHWDGYDRNRVYIRRTGFMNNYDEGGSYHYNYGPRAEVVERTTNQPVVVYRTNSTREAGPARVEGKTVSIYRPAVDKNSATTARPASVIQAPRPIQGKGEAAPKQVNNKALPAFRTEHPVPGAGTPHQVQPAPHNPQPEPQHNPQPPVRQQQPEPPHNPQPPVRQQQPEPPHNPQPPVRQQQPEPPHNPQPPVRQQQPEPPHNPQPPVRQQQPEPPHNPQPPVRQQQPEPQRAQPQRQPQSQPHPQPRPAPAQRKEEEGSRK